MSSPEFVPSGFFALRTPLLPFDDLLEWSGGLSAVEALGDLSERGDVPICPDCGAGVSPAAGQAGRPHHKLAHHPELEVACAADKALLRRRLRDLVRRTEVREALYVASPDLDSRLDVWERDPDSEAGEKIERALVRYLARMAGRATPFGLFAGCSVGHVGSETKLALAGRATCRRHTRLDMDYLVALAQALSRDADVRSHVPVHANSSLYATPGRVCYAEVRRNGKGWTHHNVAVQPTGYLESTLARARSGALPQSLAAALVEADPDATFDEAAEYIADLVDSQVLVPEIVPPLTGSEPIHVMTAVLSAPEAAGAAGPLREAQDLLAALDATELGAPLGRYRDVLHALKDSPVKLEPGRTLQVDLVKPAAQATLSEDVITEVLRGLTISQRLAQRPRDGVLARFREKFVRRYEAREVPLIEALDHEVGIGFDDASQSEVDSSSLLEGLDFPRADDETAAWGKRETVLLRLLTEAVRRGARQIEIGSRDLEDLSVRDPPPLPDAFSVMASLVAASDEDVAGGEYRVLWGGFSGPSGARLLGRFCHADPALAALVQSHLRAEEALQPEAIFAEVVHLPESRLGNILARPVLRDYEIPYLGRPSVDAEHQIPITDLCVSVVGDEIVVRSYRLGRRVIPRLTSAHNFQHSQGIYKLLCLLQGQGTAADLGWNWGPLRHAPELPRVVFGRLILARASWRLRREELEPLARAKRAARFRAMYELRAARKLPRWVSLMEGDNELPVDLDNVLAVDTLIELVKSREEAALVELLPGPGELVATGPEGRFVHELVIPFVRVATHKSETSRRSLDRSAFPGRAWERESASANRVQRSFPPGSEWLYAKLFTGQATADRILREVVRPVAESVCSTGAADEWFFIRYGDPDWHLRIRFHGEPRRLLAEVLPELESAATPFLADGRIWRMQFDTYERETERYGGHAGIRLAEQLFHADSLAVLELLAIADDVRGTRRWQMALYGADRVLTDLGLDLDARQALMKQTARAFASEFDVDSKLRKQINERFRSERKGLEVLWGSSCEPGTPASRIAAIFARRSEQAAPVIHALRGLGDVLERPLADLAASFIHMHVNRLLPSAHRAQEMVLYDFLRRLYESELARRPACSTSS